MSFIYYCPHCGQKIEVPYEQENSGGNCPACGKTITPINFSSSAYPQAKKTEKSQFTIRILVISLYVIAALRTVLNLASLLWYFKPFKGESQSEITLWVKVSSTIGYFNTITFTWLLVLIVHLVTKAIEERK